MLEEYEYYAKEEQKVLKISIFFTGLLCIVGLTVGTMAKATSIIFDSFYAGVDCFFSIAAFFISRLIFLDAMPQQRKKPHFIKRFHHGFWHLEPIVLMINSGCLILASFYGLFEAICKIRSGGGIPDLGPAVGFSLGALIMSFAMATYQRVKNKKIQSDFIAVDEKGWLISAGISSALFIAFILAYFLSGTEHAYIIPYIDPAILIFIICFILPAPVKILGKAIADILLITPLEREKEIKAIIDQVVCKYGFLRAHHYVAVAGRALMIEIHIVVPKDYEISSVSFFDEVREELGKAIGDEGPDRWFVVSFTADEKWAV